MSSIARRVNAFVTLAVLCTSACAGTAARTPLAPRVFADADSIAVTVVRPGAVHTFIRDSRGPWAIHVVEVDARSCVPVLQARKPGTALDERATTSALTRDALAGINADFFLLPGGTPVGAHVTAGVPLIGPTDRPVFAATADGWRIGTARLAGAAAAGGDTATLVQVNRPATAFSAYGGTSAGLTLFTTWIGDSVPGDSAATRVVLRLLHGTEAAGRGVVLSTGPAAAAAPLQPGSAVLLAHGPARAWARRRAAGDTVQWSAPVVLDGAATEAVGGFPELLRDGRSVLAEQTVAESFGQRRHPRTAIGWTPDQRLLLVVVDGRQPDRSDGMSLDELAWLFSSLGASHALNLDGGGSTAMVVNGALVSSPSDREGERAVGNALALVGCR